MDSRLEHGLELFNSEEFYDAHEILEDFWNDQSPPEKNYYQAIIQAAAAMHLIRSSRLPGAIKVFNRAQKNLENAPQLLMGIDLKQLETDMEKILSILKVEAAINDKILLRISYSKAQQ